MIRIGIEGRARVNGNLTEEVFFSSFLAIIVFVLIVVKLSRLLTLLFIFLCLLGNCFLFRHFSIFLQCFNHLVVNASRDLLLECFDVVVSYETLLSEKCLSDVPQALDDLTITHLKEVEAFVDALLLSLVNYYSYFFCVWKILKRRLEYSLVQRIQLANEHDISEIDASQCFIWHALL